MKDQLDQETEERRWRFAGLFRTSAGTVGLLIAIVLVTQAGLVYVAVDQIGTNDATSVVPARSGTSQRAPISVDADEREREPAPAVNRAVVEVERLGEFEEPPSDTGLDVAGERVDPQGVAPPLTGNEPPAADERDEAPEQPPAQPAQPAQPAAAPGDESPGASERAASDSPSEAPASETAKQAPPSEEGEDGPGASSGDPPGHGGDHPGNGNGDGKGKDGG